MATNPIFDFVDKFNQLSIEINGIRSVNVNSNGAKEGAKELVQDYFRIVRPYLTENGIEDAIINELSETLQNLNKLASGNNAKSSYRSCLKRIRALCTKLEVATATIEGNKSTELNSRSVFLGANERAVITTLDSMVPTAARSYQQALFDLNQEGRISYRGAAAELREAFRELLDHMAPDSEVMKATGFKFEKNTTKPTQRQKAKFILDSRRMSKTAQGAPLKLIEALDEIISSLARSIYERGSLATHAGTTRSEVMQLKKYVDLILSEFLQLS